MTMVFHGIVIAIISYIVMRFVLKQSQSQSITRSSMIGFAAAVYMIMFGHDKGNQGTQRTEFAIVAERSSARSPLTPPFVRALIDCVVP